MAQLAERPLLVWRPEIKSESDHTYNFKISNVEDFSSGARQQENIAATGQPGVSIHCDWV